VTTLDLANLQGNILRGYGRTYQAVRHLVLRISDPMAARAALAAMVDGDRSTPEITKADCNPKEAGFGWCLNVGFTWRGLEALGLPKESLDSFPPEFRQGMVARAARLGDVGTSSPERWVAGLGDADNVHLVVTIHGRTSADLDRVSRQVVEAGNGRAFSPQSPTPLDGHLFTAAGTERHVHFGYRDGISQPRFEGVHDADSFAGPFTPTGMALLGHRSALRIEWEVPQPSELGQDGTFNAFRVLGQDVAGFEEFLRRTADRVGCGVEEVAAKLCGRWRNGAPLVLASTSEPPTDFPESDLNRFGYIESDRDGSRCPIGSHIRRANPRDAPIVQRGSGPARTLIRRGMPFGPPYDPDAPGVPDTPRGPDAPRGLLGSFICASLAAQFEAMQGDWLNMGFLDPRITGSHDPLAGANDGRTGSFEWSTANGKADTIRGLPQFVRTLGGAYCFIPSIRALEWIATRPAKAPPPPGRRGHVRR